MTDTKTSGDKTLHVSSKTLSLKRPVEQGVVRQSFSHGRSKAVVVETVKRRALGPGGKDEKPAPQQAAPTAKAAPAAAPAAPTPAAPARGPRSGASRSSSGVVLRTLSEQERDARASALAEARAREEEDRSRQAEEAKRRSERDAVELREREA